MRFSDRMSLLGTETAFEVLAKTQVLEAQGRDIVHLEIGEPDFNTPPHIVEAGKQALDDGFTHYGPSAGFMALREAIALHMERTRGISVTPENVVVTPGAKPVMFFCILALAQQGDEVIHPDPGFPIYESVIRFAGARPVPVPLREELGFGLDPGELAARITEKTRLIILNSPQNPTGGVLSREDLEAIAGVAAGRRIPVLADEIYSHIQYEGRFHSIAACDGMRDLAIVLDGFSKTYAMTGWRVGYGVMPAGLAAQVTRLMTNSNSCTASFTQMAAVAALTGPQDAVHGMVAAFKERRDVFAGALNRIPGIRCAVPRGAFYLFPNVSGLRGTSREIAGHLLYEGGVAALAGTDFGAQGEGYLRFSYAASLETIQEAVRRVAACADSLRKDT